MHKGFARRLDVEPWVQIVASVRAKNGHEVHVAADIGPVFAARRPLGCLAEPEPRDTELRSAGTLSIVAPTTIIATPTFPLHSVRPGLEPRDRAR